MGPRLRFHVFSGVQNIFFCLHPIGKFSPILTTPLLVESIGPSPNFVFRFTRVRRTLCGWLIDSHRVSWKLLFNRSAKSCFWPPRKSPD